MIDREDWLARRSSRFSKRVLRLYGAIEGATERIFRYIEMIGVMALLMVAVGDGKPFLRGTIIMVGAIMAGLYLALPLVRWFVNLAPRWGWWRDARNVFLTFTGGFGILATLTGILAGELAELIEAFLRS
jgi:hypothetical protein